MSSSSVNDSGHSFDDDHNDAVLASHQDIKPSIKFLGAHDNLLSSQDDYTIDKFISNNEDGRSLTDCEIDDLFQETKSKDVRSKPLTGEGDDIDGSYWLPSKPNYVSKVSLSPPSKDTTLVLSSSGERRIPFQQLNENRNQLSSSLSTTKPSSQQLDTSCDVDINNTKQPSPTTAQSFIERKSIELQCIQKKLVQVPRATVLEVSAMQQDYAYGEAAIICDENLNQMKGHYDEECPIHDILNFSTDQLAYIRRMRDKMPKDELAQYIMDAEMALRLKILLAVPEDMRHLLTFGAKLNPGHQCLTGQNYPATHELERQSQEDREILNLCLPDDGCVSLLNLTLPLALLDMVYGEGKKVADIPEFRAGILSKMGQFDISCAGYDNLDGTQSGNRRVVDTLAKKMHPSMTRSDFYMIMQKDLGFRIELNHTIRPDHKMVISFSTAYVTKEDLYDAKLKSQDVETNLALFLRVVTHTASIYSESFRANYSREQIKDMDSSFSKLLCPIVLPDNKGEIVYPLLTDFGDKSKMSHQSYELVQKQRDENLTKARQVWAEILRKVKAGESLTKKEQKSFDKFDKHHAKTSDMWKRFNSGGYVTPQELSTIRKVTKGGEKGGATVKAAWDTAADARDDKQKAIVKAQQEGGEKGGATVKAAWDMYHDGEWDEMSLEQQSIIIAQQEGLQQFLDEAMEIRSTIDTLKSNHDGDDQFDREHALEFLRETGCNPSALSKVIFELDCREARIKYVSDSAAGRDMEEIFAEIKNDFGTSVLDWWKSCVERSMAKAEFDRLSAENVNMSADDIIVELSQMTTTVKGSKVKMFSDGTLNWVASTNEISYANNRYDELVGSDVSPDDAIAIMEASREVGDSTISWLKSCKAKRSYAKKQYNDLVGIGKSPDEIFAEIKNKFGTSVLDWLKSGVEISTAKAEFDRLSAENVNMSADDIIVELSQMTTTVKGSKVKMFSDGTISHLKSTVAERYKAKAAYEDLIGNDKSPDDALAVMKASNKFSAGSISHLESSKKRTMNSVELNKLKKSGMSSEDGIAELKKTGKLSAEDKFLESIDKRGQAWAIHRKWKGQKSLEEIRDMIRDNKNLGEKFANIYYNQASSVENQISAETAGTQRRVNKVEKALENGQIILIGTHNPIDCKGECLVIWDEEHHTKNFRIGEIDNRIGDIKFAKTRCGSCDTCDRDFTFKSAVTNSWETRFFDEESNRYFVKLTSVAALNSWSKEKKRTIRERHESKMSTTNEEVADVSTASTVAAKQPPAKKEKATKSKSASSNKTQSKSKRKPSEEKEEKKKKKKLKKLDSSKDSKMAAPTKKKDRSEKAVPKKKSTKSKPIVGSSSKAASKLASKSSKSADNGSSNKKETKIDITADRRFFIVRKVHKNDLATVQFELDMLINEFREQLDRATIVKEFIDVYRNEWREDMFEGLRNWLQELATSDSDDD